MEFLQTLQYLKAPGGLMEKYLTRQHQELINQWSATRGLDAMVGDTWRWQSANPGGYNDETGL